MAFDPVDLALLRKLGGGGGSGGGGVTSWNDLEDKPFGEMETFILPETELTFEMNEDLGAPVAFITPTVELEIGKTYTVSFAGTEYTCLYVFDETSEQGTMGNMSLFGGEDTGEPFILVVGGGLYTVIPLNGADSATMSINGLAVVPLDSEYAPDPPFLDLVGAGVPAITENGFGAGVPSPLYEGEDIVKLAAKKGIIKIRAFVDAKYNVHIVNGDGGYVAPVYASTGNEGVIEFTAHLTQWNGQYWAHAFFADVAIILWFQPGSVLNASVRRLGMYNYFTGELIPAPTT